MSSPPKRELLLATARADADKALADSTKAKYRSALISFLNFCALHSFPPVPTEALLMAFIPYSCRRISHRTGLPVSPRTVEAYLSGITSAFRHSVLNVSVISNSKAVREVLKGCKRQFSSPVARKEPLLLQDLVVVHSATFSDFNQLLFHTLLTVGFHGLYRLGELTIPDDSRQFNPCKLISRLSLLVSDCGRFVRYTLPYNKSDPFFLGSTIILSRCEISGACPVQALLDYLLRRDRSFLVSPFLFITTKGKPPTRAWFLTHFRRFFSKEKSGHSMRSGGASALARAGFPLEHIQDVGRWSSKAFKTYVRDHPLMRLPLQRQYPLTLDGHVGAEVQFRPAGYTSPVR